MGNFDKNYPCPDESIPCPDESVSSRSILVAWTAAHVPREKNGATIACGGAPWQWHIVKVEEATNMGLNWNISFQPSLRSSPRTAYEKNPSAHSPCAVRPHPPLVARLRRRRHPPSYSPPAPGAARPPPPSPPPSASGLHPRRRHAPPRRIRLRCFACAAAARHRVPSSAVWPEPPLPTPSTSAFGRATRAKPSAFIGKMGEVTTRRPPSPQARALKVWVKSTWVRWRSRYGFHMEARSSHLTIRHHMAPSGHRHRLCFRMPQPMAWRHPRKGGRRGRVEDGEHVGKVDGSTPPSSLFVTPFFLNRQ